MRTKLSRLIVILLVIVLSVCTLAGCTTINRSLVIDIADGSTVYEKVAKTAIPSVAIVYIHQEFEGEWQLVNLVTGLVVDNDHVLVNKRTVPNYSRAGFPKNFAVSVNVQGADGLQYTYDCVLIKEMYPSSSENDIGLTLLKLEDYVPDPNIADDKRVLVPCEFADSDDLAIGDNTLAISAMGEDIRVFEVIISNLYLAFDSSAPEIGSEPFGRGITPASMYTGGNHNQDECESYRGELSSSVYTEYKSSSAVLFNSAGKVVGFNYMMKVDNSESNIEVVGGIGYAIKSNAITSGLKVGGIL